MADTPTTQARKTQRDRSPSYPGIDLGEAILRAKDLYKAEKQHSTPVAAALGHWGYGAASSQGQIVLAALKKFGLLDDEGRGPQREVRLTKDAVAILLDEREGSTERAEAIRRAALAPPIHKQTWEKFGTELPSDATLKHWLRTGLSSPFTDRGVAEFIPQFKRTLAFAGLTQGGKLSPSEGDKPEDREAPTMMQQGPGKASLGVETVRFPIRVGVWGQLQVPAPMTEEDWQRMLRGIEAQKLGLVVEEAEGKE